METECQCMMTECEIFFPPLNIWRCIAVKPPTPFFFKKGCQVLLQYRVWVRRTAWLTLAWIHSNIRIEATHSTIMSTTNPTLPVLGSNMNLQGDKPSTNCLSCVTACSALQWSIPKRGNLSGTYSRKSYVKNKVNKHVSPNYMRKFIMQKNVKRLSLWILNLTPNR